MRALPPPSSGSGGSDVTVRVGADLSGLRDGAKESVKIVDDLANGIEQAGNKTTQTAGKMDVLGGAIKEATAAGAEMAGVNGQVANSLGEVAASAAGMASGVAIAFAAVAATAVAGLAIYAKAASDAHQESVAMNNAMAVTSNYAGQTQGSMRLLAQEVALAGTTTVGQAKDIVTALTASGRIGSAAIGEVSKLAENYAATAGKAVDKIAPDLVRLFADPAKGAQDLNESMHFLTAAQVSYIDELEKTGRSQEAQLALARELGNHLPQHAQQLGTLERAWAGVRQAASTAWDAMLGVGRPATAEEDVRRISKELDSLASGIGTSRDKLLDKVRGTTMESRVASLMTELQASQGLASRAASVAAENAKRAADIELQNKAAGIVSQYSTQAKISELENKRKLLEQSTEVENRDDAIKKIDEEIAKLREVKKERKDAYSELMTSIREKTAVEEAGIGTTEKLTAGETMAIKVKSDLRDGTLKLTAVQKQAVAAALEHLVAAEKTNIAEQEAAKYAKERAEYLGKISDQEFKRAESLDKSNEKLSDEIQMLGLSVGQQAAFRASKQEVAAAADLVAASTAEEQAQIEEASGVCTAASAAYRELAAAKRASAAALSEQASLTLEKSAKEVAVKQAEDAAQAWKRFSEDIERSLTDSLYRGFEAGKSFAQNFLDSLKNTFKSSVLRVAVQAVVSTGGSLVNAGINAVLGTSGSNGGSGNNYLGMANNASSLYNLWGAAAALGGGTVGASSASLLYANAVGAVGGDSLGALIAANGGWSAVPAGTAAAGGGAAASGAGTGSAAGAAASMWPLAVVAGMYMSSKLYDSGYKFENDTVKADDPKTWSLLAQAGMYNEANMVGKLFGQDNFGDSKLWQVLSGANLSRYVDEYVQKALGIRGGGPKMEAFGGDRTVSWGLAQTAPGNEVLTGIATGLETQFNAVLEKFGKSAQNIVVGLGMDADPNGDASARMGYSLKVGEQSVFSEGDVDGITMEAIKNNANRALLAALQAVDISEPVNKYLDSLGDVGKITADQITQAMGMIEAYHGLNKAMDDLHLGANSLTTGLLNAFGGVDGLQAELASYYQNYSTAEERRARVVEQITDTLNAAGANLTTDFVAAADRVDFRNWIEGIDKTTEAGQALFTAGLSVEGAFASITDSMDETAAAATAAAQAASQAASQAAADAAAKAFQDQLDGLQSAWSALTSTANSLGGAGQTGGLESMLAALKSGYGYITDLGDKAGVLEQIGSLEDTLAQKQAETVQAGIAAAQKQLDNAKALLDVAKGIKQYVDSLKVSTLSALSPEQKLAAAATQYSVALASAKAGNKESAGQLQGLADSYLGQARDYYGANAQYASIFGSVTDGLSNFADAMIEKNDPLVDRLEHQISIAQQSLSVGSRQLDLTQQLYTQAAQQFQASLQQIAQQIVATDSVKSAINALPPELAGMLSAAVAQQAQANLGNYASSNGISTSSQTLVQLAANVASGAQTIAEAQSTLKTLSVTNAAVGSMASGGILGWVLGSVMQSATAGALTGSIPGFATGGDFAGGLRVVGERGPELEVTGPSRIFSAAQTKDIFSGPRLDPQVATLLRDLVLEVRQLRDQHGRVESAKATRDGISDRRLANIESAGVLARSR